MLRPRPEGGTWLHTGDLGYLDSDGYVFLVDRKKDLIKTSGYQVWPREVEEVLAAHPDVLEVGVAGVPDPAKGEVVKAWVVLKPGTRATADELRAWCRARLAPYKVPASVEFRNELPKMHGRQSAPPHVDGAGAARLIRRCCELTSDMAIFFGFLAVARVAARHVRAARGRVPARVAGGV